MSYILLLEDEPFIALDVEMTLDEHGHLDHATFSTCTDALLWLQDNSPSTAIVDPRLTDGVCSAVVRHLVVRGIPFVVYSGETESLPQEEPAFLQGEFLMKPSLPRDLVAAVERALTRAGQVA